MAGCRVNDPRHPAPEILVALRPSVVSPTVAARQAATLDRLSNGRALFNLVTGSDPQELAGMAFSSIIPNAMKPPQSSPASGDVCWKETVTFEGKHIHVRDAQLYFPPVQQPRLPILADRRTWRRSWRPSRSISI